MIENSGGKSSRALTKVGSCLLLGLWCAPLLMTESAGAIPADIAPQPAIQLTTFVFPTGGLITGYMDPGTIVHAITDAQGNVIDGGLLDLTNTHPELSFVWQATEPLAPGTYNITTNSTTITFSVEDPIDALPTFSTTLSPLSSLDGPVTCVEGAGGSFYTEQTISAQLHVSLAGLVATQYTLEIEVDGEPVPSSSLSFTSADVGTEEREVCTEVFAVPLLGGDRVSLGEECLDTASLEGLGTTTGEFGNVNYVLLRCTVPPVGYEEAWCEAFSPAFAAPSCEDFSFEECIAARTDCPAGDHPSQEAIAQEREAREDTTSLPEPDEEDEENSSGESSNDKGGCSASSGTGTRPGAMYFLGLLSAAFVLRRRRRSLG